MRLYLIFFLIVSIGIIAYSNSLGNGFIWDDVHFVVNNEYIRNPGSLSLFFTSKQALADGTLAGENYRPLIPLSYAVDYHFWGLDPMGYHITNLLFHIANALLLFYLILIITKDRFIGLFASLLFLTHPVQTDAVSWISGRGNVMFLCFFLIALILYIKYRTGGSIILYLISLLFFLCALFSKEMSISLPLIVILYDWVYTKKESWGARVLRYLPYFALLMFYVSLRYSMLNTFGQCQYWTGSFYTTFLTMLRGIMYYLRLLFFPVNLCADHLVFPVSNSIKDISVLFSLAVLSGIVFLGFFLIKRAHHVSFSILWFFITLAPVMNIIPIRILIAERFLYLPLIGFALFTAVILRALYLKFMNRRVLKNSIIVFQVALISVYVLSTISRNKAWADEIVFNKEVIKVYPDNWRAHYYLAFVYIDRERDFNKGYTNLIRTVELSPNYEDARLLLAAYYFWKGNYGLTIDELNTVLKIDPFYIYAYEGLGAAYAMLREYDASDREYQKALALDPGNTGARTGIAVVNILKGDNEKAITILKEIITEGAPGHYGSHYILAQLILGDLYVRTGKIEMAKQVWSKVYLDYGKGHALSRIAGYLTGYLTETNLLNELAVWPQEFKRIVYYFIGVHRETKNDLSGAGRFYKKSKDEVTRSMDYLKVLAAYRLNQLQG